MGVEEQREAVVGQGFRRSWRRLSARVHEPPVQRALLKLFVPWGIAGFAFTALFALGPDAYARVVVLTGLYVLTPLGKLTGMSFGMALLTSGVPGVPGLGWSAGTAMAAMLLLILFLDAVISLFIVWNFGHVQRVPGLGGVIHAAERAARAAIARYAWLRRTAFAGLVTFAVIPLYGTGPIVSPIVGRIIGLGAGSNWLAILIGSVIRSTLLGLATLGFLGALGIG